MQNSGRKLWVENDCTRNTEGHVHVHEAWKELFGTEYHPSRATKVIDHGDSIEKQFGPISVWSIYGAWDEIIDNSPGKEQGIPVESDQPMYYGYIPQDMIKLTEGKSGNLGGGFHEG